MMSELPCLLIERGSARPFLLAIYSSQAYELQWQRPLFLSSLSGLDSIGAESGSSRPFLAQRREVSSRHLLSIGRAFI